MNRAPILLLSDVMPADHRARLIAGFDANGGEETGYEKDRATVIDHAVKIRRDWLIDDKELLASVRGDIVQNILQPLFRATWFETRKFERIIVGRYDIGGHFMPHVDVCETIQHRRFALSIALNSEYEGGELVFRITERASKLKRGTPSFFPASFCMA